MSIIRNLQCFLLFTFWSNKYIFFPVTYQSDQALLQTTPLWVRWVHSPSCLQAWVMCDFVPPQFALPSSWQLHREGWERCTCTFSSCKPLGLVELWHHSGEKRKPRKFKTWWWDNLVFLHLQLLCLKSNLTTRFLLQVLDSAGEFGWQLERVGLSGDGAGVPVCGDSGSPFSTFNSGWQVGEAPGLREPPTSAGTLQEKQRKCCNEPNLTTDNGTQTTGAKSWNGENSFSIFSSMNNFSLLHNADLVATSAVRNLWGPGWGRSPPLGATGATDRVESSSSWGCLTLKLSLLKKTNNGNGWETWISAKLHHFTAIFCAVVTADGS